MTTNNATLAEARAAGIDAAIEAIEARVANVRGAMAEHSAALRDYNACVSAVVPGLLSCLRGLRPSFLWALTGDSKRARKAV